MKRIIATLLALILFIFIDSDFSVHAKGSQSLDLDVSIGFEGKVKEGFPTVLKVTITNSGKAFSGDFVADIPSTYNAGSATVLPIEIAAGETKSFSIYLEGVSSELAYNIQQNNNFSFYEGGIEKGKLVKHTGDKGLVVQNISSDSKTMLVLTTREDEISNIEDLRRTLNADLITYYTSSKDDPYLDEDYRGLRGIDLIVVDDFAIQDLSEKQQNALLQWVQNGGDIIFAPTTTAKNGLGVFEQFKPLYVSDELQQIDPVALKNYTSTNEEDSTIQIFTSTFTEQGKPLFLLDVNRLSGATDVGSGRVIQLTFPLYDSNLKTLSGYGQIVKNSFGITGSVTQISKIDYASNWSYINELFDTFSISVWLLILGIVVYMVVIGPVLYNVLKKKDMREKLWWIIPVIAIATSLVIFLFGAKDRIFTPQVHQMALYTINEDDSLTGMYNNSILTNSSGDYTFSMDENTSAVSSNSSENYMESNNLHLNSYVKETANGKKIVLKDLNYWSVNSISGETLIYDVGNITTNLKFENEQLTGTVTSTLPVDLKDVKILSGAGTIDLPDLPGGQTIEINKTVKGKTITAPYSSSYGYNSYSISSNEKINALKEVAVLTNTKSSKPLIVGWSDVSIHTMKLNGGAKQETISYFAKAIDVENVIEGEIVITNDDIVISPVDLDTTGWIEITNENQDFMYLDNTGKLSYGIKVNIDPNEYKWKELVVEYDDYNYDLEVVNQVSGENLVLKETNSIITVNLEQYLTDNFSIQLKISRIGGDNGLTIQTPKITLKGEPAK